MKLPVLLELPRHERLAESVLAERLGTPSDFSLEAMLPEALTFDAAYAAVPNAPPPGEPAVPDALDPARASSFVVRGTVEVEDPTAIPEEIDGHRVHADPEIGTFLTCLEHPPVGSVQEVHSQLQTAALHGAGLDGEGIAIAIVDRGINLDFLQQKLGFLPRLDQEFSWRPQGVTVAPGNFPPGHGTMCAYAALIAAPKATLVDVAAILGTPPAGAPIGSRLSAVHQALAHLAARWSIAFTPSGQRKYKALVVSNSWGMLSRNADFPAGHPGRYADNPRHVFTRNVISMSDMDGVDFVFAAGNCGGECPDPSCQGVIQQTITGANASHAVLTVGGCDVTGARVGYSSRGPAIAGMFSNKPDVVACTHFLGSQALGPGVADKGTSVACPVAAGCVAALRTRASPFALTPAQLIAIVRASAGGMRNSAWSADMGHGAIRPLAAAAGLGLIPSG